MIGVQIHQRLGVAILVLGLVGAGWALLGMRRGGIDPGLRAYLALTEAAIVVQAILGLVLALNGRHPADGLHWLYGPAVLLSIPAGYSFARGSVRQEGWALFAGSFCVFLFAIRAVGTGG